MKPRYFCENCGAEVKPGAASCPACGSRFTSVRCPKCGYEGKESAFRGGCPACGYMEPRGDAARSAPEPRKESPRLLPRWFYTAALIVLVAAVAVLLVVFLTRT